MAGRQHEPGLDNEAAGRMLMAFAGVVLAALLTVELIVFSWGLLHFELRLVAPGAVWEALWTLAYQLGAREPLDATAALSVEPGWLPPRSVAIMLVIAAAGGVFTVVWAVRLRVDRWRSRSQLGAPTLSPKAKVRARTWARPRDLLHLQPREGSRTGVIRRASNRVLRLLLWERRSPERIGGDSWPLGRVRGAELRSGPGMHAIVVATSGAGKSMRVGANAAIEHDGPAVVLTNKTDLLKHTHEARQQRGPVVTFSPMTDLSRLGFESFGWSPLTGCRTWRGALLTARALYDADPSASAASAGSDGARFYNADAVQKLLPPLLHAAALSGLWMVDVLRWTGGGADELDEPRELLEEHGAWQAARLLAGVQEMDHRQRSLLMTSAGQLLAVYRFPEVQALDRHGLDVAELVEYNATLYIVVADSMQEELAPIVAALLGELMRYCEARAHQVDDPRKLPLVKIIADEAAHLAPLSRLPALLSLSRGWNVRWMVIYQSLAQVRARYGAEADTILTNTRVKLYLGPIHDRTTRDELLAFVGDEPVETTSQTSRAWGGERSVTRGEQHRPKLSSDDLARLREGMGVLVHDNDVPAFVTLPFWWSWAGARSPERGIAWQRVDRQRAEGNRL